MNNQDQNKCLSHECINIIEPGMRYCETCKQKFVLRSRHTDLTNVNKVLNEPYSKYFKSVVGLEKIDVYQVCNLFGVEDTSGALQHSIKKLLLSGSRNGNKSKYQDIKEASDTLLRWLEINKQ